MTKNSYFKSCGYTADSMIKSVVGPDLDLNNIPPFLRTMLVTDGTVTKSLEAWFWEPISITPLNNTLKILSHKVDGLEVNAGDKVLQREVYLKGDHSGQLFAAARSTVSLQHLPEHIGKRLEEGEIGIGELLREQGVETYRDIFDVNYIKSAPAEDALTNQLPGEIIARSYRIRVNGHPAIIVTEFFPISIYS
ncbi:chorismate lyase [Cocleimonas sp. KMM 6892]|uniref:chorismate--pyruvate lyase family protein n=1 Tax=unclassified Cocleimonas TaxID=2639732 RepID=UPI002DB56F3E|nr:MULTISPECIES: chorismate lyase [unclassified Cocleimonas]MEB8433972.1 chorismate lyase [Cocleimonas sp. KMM 6892]MEC4716783.1 chorismate lyase [Cocleimonas sp. KMM 6895]MEC4746062.1 chorismate lyase [Cocleimonas sp. KMM 6896]